MNNLGAWASWAQIISLPVAVAAIVVAIVLYRRSKERRALACIFDPIVAPIKIEAGGALRGEIEIRYMGKPVENLSLVQAKLKNTGNLSIRKEHLIEPVTFTFGPGSELLRPPVVLQKNPENLRLEWTIIDGDTTSKPNSVSLSFDLLNPRDELTVQFICTGASAAPQVDARIEGVQRIELFDPRNTKPYLRMFKGVAVLILIFVIVIPAIVAFSDPVLSPAAKIIVSVLLMSVGYLGYSLGSLLWPRG